MVRACLTLAAMLGCFALAVAAQVPEKKIEPGKSKEIDKTKSKDPAKTKAAEEAKGKLPLDKFKPLSPDSIVVVVDDLLEAMGIFPKFWVLSLEKYQELTERIRSLEKQLKVEEVLPSFCKLQAKLDGDYLAIKADYVFATEQPRSTVFVGLLHGHLTGPGSLDGQPPIVEVVDKKGFIVRVDKAGTHQLTLNAVVRVRSAGGGSERTVELGLPYAAGGSLQIDLPVGVKEFRSNDELEKPKQPGRWSVPIGKSKHLKLAWKEPMTQTGNAPLYEVDGHIQVRMDDTHANIKGDLNIQVLRPTKEWRLLLPAGATAYALAPSDEKYAVQPPQGDAAHYTFKLPPSGGDRWRIAVALSVPRPHVGGRLPIGPFAVLGATTQKVVISVQTPADVSAGQRLVFHRQPGVSLLKNTETEASFAYVPNGKVTTGPLELEWRYDKTQLETQVKHALKWKTQPWGWQLDVESRIELKTVFASATAIDLRLPLPRPRGGLLAGTVMPGTGFPGLLPWGGLWADPAPEEAAVLDDVGNLLKVTPQDAFGKTRVSWGSPAKKMTLLVKNTYQVARLDRQLKLELPRPINTQDRGAKLTIAGDEGIELLHGPAGAEVPVPERHRFSLSWEQTPGKIDLAWRPHQREITAEAVVDITVHEHTAEIRQSISFPWQGSASDDPNRTHATLRVPRRIQKLTVLSEGDSRRDLATQTLVFQPRTRLTDKVDVLLHYDLAISAGKGTRTLAVPLVWPTNASRREVKVRVWSRAGGTQIRVADELVQRGTWKERSIEWVAGSDRFPLLVLQGSGSELPLTLEIAESIATQSAAPFLAERGLVQVAMNPDGDQEVRLRFLVRKWSSDRLEMELPLPVARLKGGLEFALLGRQIDDWDMATADPAEKRVRVKISTDVVQLPGVFEIQYTIPADALELNTRWRTRLEVPTFRQPPAVGSLRWQLALPASMIGAATGARTRVDTHWTVHGWLLTPELNGPDLEEWIGGKGVGPHPAPVTFAFAQSRLETMTIYHMPRSWWLLCCSGFLLVGSLGLYFSPMPRTVFMLVILLFAIGFMALALLSPALLPAILFGAQPGVVLLILFIGAHWLWHERQRRRLMVLPTFSRTKPTSTVTMPAAKRPREPSTVDAPASPDGGPPTAPTASSSSAG